MGGCSGRCCGEKYSKLQLNLEDTSIYKTLSKYSKSKSFIQVPFSNGISLQIISNVQKKKALGETLEEASELPLGDPKKYYYIIYHNNKANEPRYRYKFDSLTDKNLILFRSMGGAFYELVEIKDMSGYCLVKNGIKIYNETFDVRMAIQTTEHAPFPFKDIYHAVELFHVFRK